ncbi:hypothetical protein LZ554_004309 [Drepanopeziza brunnea f. sp. 'monogermtubi']|nr:hypothetical protein LZ554_004309 [Drepanopeziza brunnea f. sp. 'monogermtubi']
MRLVDSNIRVEKTGCSRGRVWIQGAADLVILYYNLLEESHLPLRPDRRSLLFPNGSGYHEVIDLVSSDEDEPQSKQKKKPIYIDCTTPSPPSRQPRMGPGNAPKTEAIPAVHATGSSAAALPKAPPSKVLSAAFSASAALKVQPSEVPSSASSTLSPFKAQPSKAPSVANAPIKAPPSLSSIKTVPPLEQRFQSPRTAAAALSLQSSINDTPERRMKSSPETESHPGDSTPKAATETQGNDSPTPKARVKFVRPLRIESSDASDEDSDFLEDILPAASAISADPSQRSHPLASSIGTHSPLMTRIQRKRTADGKSTSPREAIARRSESKATPEETGSPDHDLEDTLRIYCQAMKDDHACATRYLIADARKTAQEFKSAFTDKISPFRSLTSVKSVLGEQAPAGTSTETVNRFQYSKGGGKLTKSKSTLIATKVCDNTPRVPKYTSHTNVRRNILRPDDETLKFVPFIEGLEGPKDRRWDELAKEMDSAYTGHRNDETGQEIEEQSRIRSYIPLWLDELHQGCDLDDLKHYLLLRDVDVGDLGLDPRNQQLLIKTLKPFNEPTKIAAKRFCEAFDNCGAFKVSLEHIVIPATLLNEMIAAAKKVPFSPVNRIETYASMTCLICAAIDCPTHGDFMHERLNDSDMDEDIHDPETKYEPLHLALNYEDSLRKHQSRASGAHLAPTARGKGKRCTEACYLSFDFSEQSYQISQENLAHIPSMLLVFKDPVYRACLIAFALDIPCWTVYAEIEKLETEGLPERKEEQISGRPKKPAWYDNKRKFIHGDLNDQTTAHLHQMRTQAVPCGHAGACIERPGDERHSCHCATSDILCESFCGCPDDCPRRFTGCPCNSYGISCTTGSCICIQMNRECGPECGSCGALERIDPINKYNDDLFKTGCQNVWLQRGVSKATVMGESQLVGFGLYLAETVKKGDFISEYTGENISSEEADRRGIVYDRKLLSFLFDLNRDRVIDAARLGNKTRFINHASSATDGLNCEAKIMLVNGEHRIKFFALRDIDAGEELLFNYGEKFAEKQGLNKTLPKAKAGSKWGVLEGDEALDALDGMDQRKRGTREKMYAIRGGKADGKPGRGGKMRKSALSVRPDLEAAVDEPVEDDDYNMTTIFIDMGT